jgi:hypothetical protein
VELYLHQTPRLNGVLFKVQAQWFHNLKSFCDGEYSTRNFCFLEEGEELCPMFGILKNTFLKLDLFPSSGGEREMPTVIGPLERSTLSHWTQ